MRFAKYSPSLTKAAGFDDKHSKIGIRADGSLRYVLKGQDWTNRTFECAERDKFRCVKCGTVMFLDPHHILPKGKGGGDDLANLETRCRTCHNAAHPEKRVRLGERQ